MKPESEKPEDSTGLPWPHTWPAVYVTVLGIFGLWVALLAWLTHHYA